MIYVDHRWLLHNWIPKMLNLLLNPTSSEMKKSHKWTRCLCTVQITSSQQPDAGGLGENLEIGKLTRKS